MARGLAPGRRTERVGSCLLLVAAALTVIWAGLGSRYGRHWYHWLFRHRPGGIVIHHTASDGYRNGELLTAAMIDADHAAKGWGITYRGRAYHIGYHYVIRADGVVEPGRPEEVRGAHTPGRNDYVGICLVGNFSSRSNLTGQMQPASPTPAQMDALERLLRELMAKYDLETSDIHRHGDFAQTSCPGDRFPFETLIRSLDARPAANGQPPGPEPGD